MKTKVNLSRILTPEELQWFGQWLSKSQMDEGLKSHAIAEKVSLDCQALFQFIERVE
jgi:hypothetical protein